MKLNWGIDQKHCEVISALFKQFPKINEAVLFGSRVKGNPRKGSDIDIALKGKELTTRDLIRIEASYDKCYLPWKLDFVIYHAIENSELKDHIDRVGSVIYRR